MAKKTARLQAISDCYCGNAYPAMVKDLADHIHVAESALRTLEIGWAPAVAFKSGLRCGGWWSVPERNAVGEVIGIGLRSQDGSKITYPGSNRGCVYGVNPDYTRGRAGYTPGPHNWVRTGEIECPVCHKSKGCLVSSDNPEHPAAVICVRERSDHPCGIGHLHILGPKKIDGYVLPSSDKPILVVEGMTDVAAAMTIGFVSIGRPSALGGLEIVSDLVRGNRPVVVIGENDKKPNGTFPGRDGMLATFQACRAVNKNVCMVMPPEDCKDFRAWVNRLAPTPESLLRYFEKNGERNSPDIVLTDSRPLTIAKAYLEETGTAYSRSVIRRFNNRWFRYANGSYNLIADDEELKDSVYQWAHEKFIPVSDEIKPLSMSRSAVSDVLEALQSEVRIPGTAHMPCWINGICGEDAENLVAFSDGILSVPRWMAGDPDALMPPTPDLFTTATLPYRFDPGFGCTAWEMFLKSSLGDDPKKIDLLQEWFGYCLVPDRSQQKMMYMRGPTAAGKGVIIRTLEAMVGERLRASATLTSIIGSFGLHPLVGKLICTMPDVRIAQYTDAMRGLELLLSITGDDAVQINRKHREIMESVHLNARVTMASNGFLDVPDHASALLRRVLILDFEHSFKDNPDRGLSVAIDREIPAIAVWALEGLKRLRNQGHFTATTADAVLETEWRVATNPLAAFVEECCDVKAGNRMQKEELFDAWTAWSAEHRFKPCTRSQFYERVRFAIGGLELIPDPLAKDPVMLYDGVDLKQWAREKYT